jgi:phosphotransferase system HPr (HPr) family protein
MIAVSGMARDGGGRFLGCKPVPAAGACPVSSATMSKSDATPASQPLTKELIVQNKMGIHARPAAMIVRVTNKFKAEVFVEKDEEQVNGKSIMGLMMLAAGQGLESEVHRDRRRRRADAGGTGSVVYPQV